MATTDAGLASDAHEQHGHGHSDHDHDHPSYLAHHFDTPEQQFDSGKLGMWLFLVTEVLFFSGMFCAYAIFRAWRPEVFEGCSQFLNTKLGAINTGVLLFSSFTMAWGVRCAQKEQHKLLTVMLATTLSCATVFLGVKAIEYSHKWHLGLLPAGLFTYDESNPHPHVLQSTEPLLVNGSPSSLTSKISTVDAFAGDEESSVSQLVISGTNPDHSKFSTDFAIADDSTLASLVASVNQASEGASIDVSEDGHLVFVADAGSSDHLELTISAAAAEGESATLAAFELHDPSPNYLAYICAPFVVLQILITLWLVWSFVTANKFHFECAKPLWVVCLCFFVGVGLGTILESGGHDEEHGPVASAAGDGSAAEHGDDHGHGHPETSHEDGHAEHAEESPSPGVALAAAGTLAGAGSATDNSADLAVIERLATDATNTGLKADLEARKAQAGQSVGGITYDVADDSAATVTAAEDVVLRKSRAGVFFSIYYCMTGVHAIHILAGMVVLSWLLVRASKDHFNEQYFGPVDYVGLYWHIVDLIWIFLFPLLYLI